LKKQDKSSLISFNRHARCEFAVIGPRIVKYVQEIDSELPADELTNII
jgi:hypothetical protein